jgi:hypothetical protein
VTAVNKVKYTKSLKDALNEKYRLLQQNNDLVGGPSLTVDGTVVVTEVLPTNSENEKLNQKNGVIQAAFDRNIALVAERDVTLPARVIEINASLSSMAQWNPYETLNNQINGPKGWKAEIAKLPIKTIAEYDTKIAQYTRVSTDPVPRPLGVIALRESELAKAIAECDNPEQTLLELEKNLAFNQRILDNTLNKLATMEAVNRGVVVIVSDGVGTSDEEVFFTIHDKAYFQQMTDEELNAYIVAIGQLLAIGNNSYGQTLTPSQQDAMAQNLGLANQENDGRVEGEKKKKCEDIDSYKTMRTVATPDSVESEGQCAN